MDSFSDAGRGDLSIRWTNIAGDDLLNNHPVALSGIGEVISIFKHSWDVIFSGMSTVERARALPPNTLSYFDFYDSFNKRVMESIAAFRINHP